MRKVQLIGPIRYLAYLLVAIQAGLILVMATFLLSLLYDKEWTNIQESPNGQKIYLKNLSQDRKEDLLQLFNRQSELTIITSVKNTETQRNMIGVAGSANHFPTISILGSTLVSQDDISTLLTHHNKYAAIGNVNGSINEIKEVPSISFGSSHAIVKLETLMEKNGSVNGDYTIYGFANDNEVAMFLKELSAVTNQSPEELVKSQSGSNSIRSLMSIYLFIFSAMTMVSPFVLFLSIAISSLKNFGNLLLLGWSKVAIAKKLFTPFVLLALSIVPLFGVSIWYMSGWYVISKMALSYIFLSGLFNILLIVLMISVACILVFSMKSIDAIKGKIPTKSLYAIGTLGYIVLSVMLVWSSVYLDGPMKMVAENIKTSQQWKSVSDYLTLRDVLPGNDAGTIMGSSNTLNQDFYDWYYAINQDPSVFIASTEYMSQEILDNYRSVAIYESVPDRPFWYMTYSPSYLKELGIDVEEAIIKEAESGVKVYLIPDTYTDSEKANLIAWIKENDVMSITEDDIATTFNEHKSFKFIDYHYKEPVFNWNTEAKGGITTLDAVIYMVTPENMHFKQSESLRVNDLSGFIKFKDEQTAEKYTTDRYLTQYHLNDNKLKFVKIEAYINGLQKDLKQMITWFLGIILGIIVLSIVVLLSLAYVYRLSNNERLYVSKFLGFDFFKMYKVPVILLLLLWVIEALIVILFQSNMGMLLVGIYGLLQLIIFYFYMSRNDIKQLLLSIKEK